ncbi:MAG: mechanosensitive ion channel [Porphyromonadaceae bacterium]|nr:mechanosensitive ion channel [Porphyromonadaceae bacterium]
MEKFSINEFLSYPLLTLGSGNQFQVIELLGIILVVFVAFIVLFLIKRAIYSSKRLDEGKKYSLNNLTKYSVYVIAFAICLNLLGFQLKFVLAGSAALLVGIGLGLQNLFADFVSGIILLLDSSIKVNDVIDVDGLVCKVEEINLRTTLVLTRDDKYILLPNKIITQNKLINWTHNRSISRFEVSVGVDYSSDIEKVNQLLLQSCKETPGIAEMPEPFVRFKDFGNSSLDFTVYFWCDNVFRVENIKSDIRKRINRLFNENNIIIPFPQRVLHIQNQGE